MQAVHDGYGVVATEDIAIGSNLMEVPISAVINEQRALESSDVATSIRALYRDKTARACIDSSLLCAIVMLCCELQP